MKESIKQFSSYNNYYQFGRLLCRVRILAFFLILNAFLVACSSISTDSLKIEKSDLSPESGNENSSLGNPYSIEKIDEDPYTYLLQNQDKSHKFFATALKECGIKRTINSVATTRQLLVGMKDIKIKSQQKVETGDLKYLLSIFSAKLDDLNVDVVCYSYKQKDCVKDLILWSAVGEGSEQVSFLENLAQTEKDNFARLIKSLD